MFARYVRHAARLLAIVIPAVLVVPAAATAATGRDPISPPAFRLPDVASPERYEVRLAIDPKQPDFSGEVAISARLKRATGVLWLNATAISVERAQVHQGGREVRVEVVAGGEDFVGLRGRFEAGPAQLRIAYKGKVDALIVDGIFRQEERGEWYVLTQFQAIGARRAFPCFDEPQWKTPWRITIDAPGSEVVVANTPEVASGPVDGRPGWRRHSFLETKPLPSYLVAFAVGPFDVVDGGVAGKKKTPLRYITPRGRGAEARYAKESTPRLLERLEEYFGIPYPFEKLDSIVIPQLATFAAMENVGLITYGSQWMLARPHEETPKFQEVYAGLAAHEIAHMWFGNLVTLAWWDDTWLNEAFASWIATKVAYALEPRWDNGVYRSSTRSAALSADRLATARSIAGKVENRNAIDDAFDDITYYKGEEVLSMFEGWLGPEAFRAGVRAFLERHAWGSATSSDFFRAMAGAAGDSARVLAAFRGFVDQPGAPHIEAVLDCTGARPVLVVAQRRFRPVGSSAWDLEWTTPACFRYRAGGKDLTQCAPIDNVTWRVELKEAPSCPAWIVGNAGGAGHYVVRYLPSLLERNLGRFGELPQHEAQAFLNDVLLQAEGGLMSMADALRAADAGLRHDSPNVRLAATRLLEGLRDDWLSPADAREMARVVGGRVVPMARTLGWTPRAADSADVRELRGPLLRLAAARPEGAALRAEGRALALRWIDDPQAVDATVAASVVETAGRFADPATYARLEVASIGGESWRDRSTALRGLASVADPALAARARSLALDTRLDGRGALRLLTFALEDDRNRDAAIAFVLANVDAIEARLPRDTMASLLVPMGSACTAALRDAIARTFEARAPRYMTGALRYAQALESIELCIDARR